MSKWSKWLLSLGILAFLLCYAAVFYLGVCGMQQRISAVAMQSDATESNPIDSFKTLRQQLRALQKAQLNDVAHDADTDHELASMAQRQLLEICCHEEQEMTIEGVLQLRGWNNPVVTVHKDTVNVLLQCETISQQESTAILDLVCRETGAMSGNVKIIPIK